ncbi:molybdopterin-synthase adenylyltransferase MoeB [Motiliproteus sediminis]|uniref:molybdopterin-synthase adenylyltransferase MoeB n=1 Tax=Motiliproteus sediminis TaxID=1468178 RepID=UPI001AEFC09C|nr:molybdopterin-synthase adenylyltransferase MoeB [Motiliproteus sediminis]
MREEELRRYNRQVILPDIGRDGQEKLLAAKVLCVGAGGLGSPASLYLAAAGIGTLGLVDDDEVDLSNLQRQVLFASSDAGRPKAEAGQARLQQLNPLITVNCHRQRLTAANAEAIFSQYDLVLDGSDNFATKFLVNDCAVKLGMPLVYGSILGFDGQMAVFWADEGPCYRCMLPQPPSGYVPNCAEAGVIGAVAGVIGCMQALEAIKLIVGGKQWRQQRLQPMVGKLSLISTHNWQQTQIDIPKNPACPCCSLPREQIQLQDEATTACAVSTVAEVSAAELRRLEQPLLLDVRSLEEFRRGHLPGALNIPLDQLPQHPLLSQLDHHRDAIVYCQSGGRSRRAIEALAPQGFSKLYNLQGGLALWPGELVTPADEEN